MSSKIKIHCAYSLVLFSFLSLIAAYTFYPQLYLLSGLCISLGAALILLYSLNISLYITPQQRLQNKLDALKAGGNDLAHAEASLDDINPSPLELAFNDFLGQVHDSISNLKTVAQRLAQLSNQVANHSQDSQTAIKRQQPHLQFANDSIADSQFTYQYLSSHLEKTRQLNQDNLNQGLANQKLGQQQVAKMRELKTQADAIGQVGLDLCKQLNQALDANQAAKQHSEMAKVTAFNALIEGKRSQDNEKAYLIISNDVSHMAQSASLQVDLVEKQLTLLLQQSQNLAQHSLDLKQQGHILNNAQQDSLLANQELLDKQQQLESIHQKVFQTLSQQSKSSALLSAKLAHVSEQFDHNADAFDNIADVGDLLIDCSDKLDKDLQQFNVTGIEVGDAKLDKPIKASSTPLSTAVVN